MDAPERCQQFLRELYGEFSRIRRSINKENCEKLEMLQPQFDQQIQRRTLDLERKYEAVIIAGEASAGKSSLINELLGLKLVKVSSMPTTDTIYRIHKSEELRLICTDKEGKEIQNSTFENEDSLRSALKKVDAPELLYVDIFLFKSTLKDNVVLVDTPGVGISREQNELLLTYIPHAVAFVFVVNVANAGGFQKGRLMDVFKDIKERLEEMPCFDPKDVLFVMNKWDRVDEQDHDEVLHNANEVLLEEWCYVSMAPENTFHVSLKKIKEGRDSSNTLRAEFDRFKASLGKMIEKNCNKRLKAHSRFKTRVQKNDMNSKLKYIKMQIRYLGGLVFDARCSIIAALTYEKWRDEGKPLLDEENTERDRRNQKMNEFSMLLTEEAEKLARKCKTYMSSELLKRGMLESVAAKSSLNPHQTLFEEFIYQFEAWCKRGDVASTVKDIDLKIDELSKKSKEDLKMFMDRITGHSIAFPDTTFDIKRIVHEFIRVFPKAVSFHIIQKVVWHFSSTSSKEDKLQSMLEGILENCSQAILVRSIKTTFNLYFSPKIDYLLRANSKQCYIAHLTIKQFGVQSEMSDEERGNMNTIFNDLKKVSCELEKLQRMSI